MASKGLTPRAVQTAAPEKGVAQIRINDGGGLSLLVRAKDKKWWVFRRTAGKTNYNFGFGPACGPEAVTLENARELAADVRKAIKSGRTPKQIRQTFKMGAGKAAPGEITFRDAAMTFYKDHAPSWRSAIHRNQFMSSLESYVFPVIGAKAPAAVTTADVLLIVRPLWNKKNETAVRVLSRIRKILAADAAETGDFRFNVATMAGHINAALPPRRTARPKVEHHAALPHREVSALMAELAQRGGLPALALRLLIATATRVNEVLAAHWGEVNLDQRLWTVPAARTKTNTALRVPLSDAAMMVFSQAAAFKCSDAVFPGRRAEGDIGILSRAALQVLLGRMGYGPLETEPRAKPHATPHGFRAAFRSWAADAGKAPEVAEAALNHAEKFVPGYQRSDYLDRRRVLMGQWSEYIAPMAPAGGVTDLDTEREKRAA